MTRYNAEEHQAVHEDGWVYHFGVVVFSAQDHTGETIHVWCPHDEAPKWMNISPQHLGGAIQTA